LQKSKAFPKTEIEVKAAEYDKLEQKKKQLTQTPPCGSPVAGLYNSSNWSQFMNYLLLHRASPIPILDLQIYMKHTHFYYFLLYLVLISGFDL
jgi:hypothetical protein